LARQQDLTKKKTLETPCLSSFFCGSEQDEVFMNLIKLTYR